MYCEWLNFFVKGVTISYLQELEENYIKHETQRQDYLNYVFNNMLWGLWWGRELHKENEKKLLLKWKRKANMVRLCPLRWSTYIHVHVRSPHVLCIYCTLYKDILQSKITKSNRNKTQSKRSFLSTFDGHEI